MKDQPLSTTTTVVPVTCSSCCADMQFTITRVDIEHRHWSLNCPVCGSIEDAQRQRRHHLWVNDSDYIGSYWGPDDWAHDLS